MSADMNTIAFFKRDNCEVLRFTADRKVIVPGDMYESARAFWEIVQQMAPAGWELVRDA